MQKRARILLAEDNLTNQMATLAILENMGFLADAVANGQEAIDALATGAYDLVLMDCEMPVLNGYEATKVIRTPNSNGANQQVVVIAMTAHGKQAEKDRCLQCGMNDFLAKPVLPQALAQKLEQWLSKDLLPPAWEGCAAQPEPTACAQDQALPIWDQDGMLARLMGDTMVAQTISRGFLADLPQQIILLEASFSNGLTAEVVRQAHTIKGAAAIIGGERLKAAARAIEQSAQTGPLAPLKSHIEALRLEFEVLIQQMEHKLRAKDPH